MYMLGTNTYKSNSHIGDTNSKYTTLGTRNIKPARVCIKTYQ